VSFRRFLVIILLSRAAANASNYTILFFVTLKLLYLSE
jgi:hypothetical protein